MARIWKERFDSAKHSAPLGYSGSLDEHFRAPTLTPKDVILVRVASFTFQFLSTEQLSDCLAYFEQKIHPSSRLQMPAEKSKGLHWEAQRWFERLPIYLLEGPKRQKVVEALRRAQQLIEQSKL